MAISVGNDFDLYECLKREVEEMEQYSNCIFLIESSDTVENANPYHLDCFDFLNEEYVISLVDTAFYL